MAADITDVARRAGVSIATVSRALRGLPDVAPATRDRVLAAARELNYAPSLFAAAIVHGRTATVAVVVSFLTRWFTGEVLAAVQAVLQPDRYDLLLYDVADPQQRAAFFAALPVRKRVDALLITAVPLSVSEADAVLRLRIPVGLIGAGRSGFHCARINDFAAARTAVEHLLGLGHRRIAFVGTDPTDPTRHLACPHRRRGYLDALRRAGIAPDPTLQLLSMSSRTGADQAARTLLGLPQPPTAIFAASDEMAFGVLRAVRRAGLQIPDDIALIGFDDHPAARLLDLSTIHQPITEQATDVTQRLLTALGQPAQRPVTAVFATQLVARGSTDPTHSTYRRDA